MRINQLQYISLDSVLYDISTMMDEKMWEESIMREWAHKGLRKLNASAKYVETNCLLRVEEHKTLLPSDVKYLTGAAYRLTLNDEDLEELKDVMNLADQNWNPSLDYIQNPDALPTNALQTYFSHTTNKWRPMRISNNPFLNTLTSQVSVIENPEEYHKNWYDTCEHELSIEPNGCIVTTLKDGYIYLAYLTYAKDGNGSPLIPDDEDLKEALYHYCMYRYWLSKSTLKEQASHQERNFHLKQFEVLKAKAAAKLNSPSILQLESIRAQRNRLVPREERYSGHFSKLNMRENIRF